MRRDDHTEDPLDDLVVERAMPVIETVIRNRCRYWRNERDDLRSEVIVRLLRRLRESFGERRPGAMENFEGYVARIASRVVDDAIRATHPEWARLKHRIRYLATHDGRFALTAEGDVEMAGQPGAARIRTAAAETLARDLTAVLRERGGRLPLDDLVSATAERTGLSEPVAVPEDRFVLGNTHDPDASLDAAQILGRLWNEIVLLPYRQRFALLLSARDPSGESVLRLLPATKLVPAAAMSVALGIDGGELARLTREAPLSDSLIAARLGVKVQQVINLRKAARDRLARRLARPR